jgi:hypothetical protein
VIELEVRK